MAGGEGRYATSLIKKALPRVSWTKHRGHGHGPDMAQALARRRRRRGDRAGSPQDLEGSLRRRRIASRLLIVVGVVLTIGAVIWYPLSGIRGKWVVADTVVLGMMVSLIWIVGIAIRPSPTKRHQGDH